MDIEEPCVICSIDKDLKQVPGRHYNLSSGDATTVTQIEGIRHFYKQLLIGDRVDNITGVRGIGKVKAGNILDACTDEIDMFERVRILYSDDERLLRTGRLLWVRRKEGELWRHDGLDEAEFMQGQRQEITTNDEGPDSLTLSVGAG